MKNVFKKKNVLIVGCGKSGKSSLNFLQNLGAYCYVYDDDKEVLKNMCVDGIYSIINRVDETIIKIMDFLVVMNRCES